MIGGLRSMIKETKKCSKCKKTRYKIVFEGSVCRVCLTGEKPQYKDKRYKIKID